MARALRAGAISRRGKNSVRNLRYGPQTRLVRGMYQSIIDDLKTFQVCNRAWFHFTYYWSAVLVYYWSACEANSKLADATCHSKRTFRDLFRVNLRALESQDSEDEYKQSTSQEAKT